LRPRWTATIARPAARERERVHLINTTLAGIATEELNLVNAVKSAKGGATIPALVEALEAAQARRKEGEARLAQLNQFEVDAKEYQAKIAALRERWKDWEGALQGDGEKDLDLARQFIKKLLVSPVFIIPLERGSWRWETVGSYCRASSASARPTQAAKPEQIAATIRQALLAACRGEGLPPIAGGSDQGVNESGSASGPPCLQMREALLRRR
jgi:hypothetical protein